MNALQAAACHMGNASATSSAPEYKLQFFSEDESQVLDQLMEMIIPGDSQSPGAHTVKCNLFADLMVYTSDDSVKKQWRDGIRLIREEDMQSSLADALRKTAGNEGDPRTDLERFFAVLKEMTVRQLLHFRDRHKPGSGIRRQRMWRLFLSALILNTITQKMGNDPIPATSGVTTAKRSTNDTRLFQKTF
jgi:hypothetical protein